MRRAALRLACAAVPLLAASAFAQSPPPPCPGVKGRVVSVDPRGLSVTVETQGRREAFPVAAAAAARVRELKPNDVVTLERDCLLDAQPVTKLLAVATAPRPTPTAGTGTSTKGTPATMVLVATETACTLSVDWKPWGPLAAGVRTELKLTPGEHMLEAATPDGRSWKEKVKVGGEQMIVEVKLSQPAATLAQYDAQAARVHGALEALKSAGLELDEILKKKSFKFDKAESAAVSTAAAAWTRDLAALKAMVAPPERTRVTEDLAALDADARAYADLMEKALETAQKNYSVLGEATRLRGQAQAKLEMLRLPAETLALIPRPAAVR